ncbi:PREDICTED: MRG/MORF4L-binding protein [Chaetura pelagica]|uniref:MRG/MORF4L-binding protein n=1 Tax=Chaetura pelagica TaxID=8897 RepID=UPI00052326F7|nr:PREDICTED: MRG/MORF4L-binding protein [Chaetura pelagica]
MPEEDGPGGRALGWPRFPGPSLTSQGHQPNPLALPTAEEQAPLCCLRARPNKPESWTRVDEELLGGAWQLCLVAEGRDPRGGGIFEAFGQRVNRHFHMICIRDKFSQNIGRQISSKVIWDHLSTMYDMQALHESEILPFPNIEKNFALPDEMIQEVREGKVMIEEEVKEEIKEEMETHAGPEEVFAPSGSLGKGTEKPSSKEREKTSSESGSKEGSDKRKRNRVTEKVLNANSNPSSPSAAKRRRT